MGNDVSVLAFAVGSVGQVESSSHASGTGIGIIVWNGRDPGRVGEADGDRG